MFRSLVITPAAAMRTTYLLFSACVFLSKASASCTTDLDCSLNGDCVKGACICDPAWSASPQCDVLALKRQPRNNGTFLGYKNQTAASWGGNVVFHDGVYHLFVAQMVGNCGLGQWGTNSKIVRAESSSPLGPFAYKQTIIEPFAHNPTVRKLPNNSGFVLYMIGGTPSTPIDCSTSSTVETTAPTTFSGSIRVSYASSVEGPWSKPELVFFTRSDGLYSSWTNPSPHIFPDGSAALAFQAHPKDTKHNWEMIGMATAANFSGPFAYTSPKPITPEQWYCVAGQDEDPFLWKSSRGYHIITHGMCPAGIFQAHYKFSRDGVTWYTSPRQTYEYKVYFEDNSFLMLPRVERPQLLFARHNSTTGDFSNPVALYNGVCTSLDCVLSCTKNPSSCRSFTLAREIHQ